MANIILTNNCQRKCEYCFAGNSTYTDITFSDFIKAVDFISTGHNIVNLIGGEPTLHIDFISMIEYLLRKGFTTQVFTNGMVSDELINYIDKIIDDKTTNDGQLTFAVNINEERYKTKEEITLQDNFLRAMGKNAYLSFTIHDCSTNLIFLKDIINKYELEKTLRIGLALPVFGFPNKHLPIESYKKAAKNIIDLINNKDDINVMFDCGFPLCMFSINEIGILNSSGNKSNYVFECGQPIDIHPDLSVTNCYPLKNVYRNNISDFNNMEELRHNLDESLMTAYGIHGEKCGDCYFFRKVCFGGCKGFYKPVGQIAQPV